MPQTKAVAPRHIVIVSDAWQPQINGVVRTYEAIKAGLEERGHKVTVIGPNQFKTCACPGYPDIKISLNVWKLKRLLDKLGPFDALHIPVEGTLGWAARSYARKRKIPYSTAYHTAFPEYLQKYLKLPTGAAYNVLKKFHKHSHRIMVPTPQVCSLLHGLGLSQATVVSRGIDPWFTPYDVPSTVYEGLKKPIAGYFGRVALEKKVDDFLALKQQGWKGSLVVIGDGPQLPELKKKFNHPDIHFYGMRTGDDLARHVAGLDVFVFPSRTDTFGRVLIEANACGVPWVAYAGEPGPRMILDYTKQPVGLEVENLLEGAQEALSLSRGVCAKAARRHFSPQTMLDEYWQNLAFIR